MERAVREGTPGPLVLDVRGRPGPPPLRFVRARDGGPPTLHQGDRTLTRALPQTSSGGTPISLRSHGDGCCRELHLHRLPGHRSPLPPLRAATMRTPAADWRHRCARWLEDSPHGPLHDGRWSLTARASFAPGIWNEDFVRDWPDTVLELLCGGGWHGVLPLRPLSRPDAPRVKAYRKHAREGTLAPVLLWWVPFLDGWLVLDGHDRAVAALAEGAKPACVVLARLPAEAEWRLTADAVGEGHAERMSGLPARPADARTERRRAALVRGYADALATLPYDEAPTPLWPPADDA
ncbi:hypothetical protein KBZ94_34010 [Streptomyces sp. RM72]|uniref:hypothetical protein n=1 Tax=Streptomyces sp. RM72 TaxID=1115510 RepID=UPI001B39B34F|nr:hypothetical protein [Streptomyces sp. RM72]MBQ0889886.1 hypothetical protein [Streptomyces sp. RM72]